MSLPTYHRADVVRFIHRRLITDERLVCAFSSSKLLEYYLSLRYPEESTWGANAGNWIKVMTRLPLAARGIAEIFFIFLQMVSQSLVLLASPKASLNYHDGVLAYSRTPVHLKALQRIDDDAARRSLQVRIPLHSRIRILCDAFTCYAYDMKSLYSTIDSLDENRKLFLESFYLLRHVYLFSVFDYLRIRELLNLVCAKKMVKEIVCFEGGYIAAAVVSFSDEKGVVPVFIQHGILSNGNELIRKFGRYHFLFPHDREYYEHTLAEKITDFTCTPSAGRFSELRSKDNTALLSLTYPSQYLSQRDMISAYLVIIGSLSRHNWRIVVRNHPRDRSGWYLELLKAYPSLEIDHFQEQPLETSLEQNGVSVMVCMYSTAVIDALGAGVLPVNFYHRESEINLVFDFAGYSVLLKNEEECDEFFGKSSEFRNSIFSHLLKEMKN